MQYKKLYKQTKMANKAGNKQPHFCTAFQMGAFNEQPGVTASTFRYPRKILAPSSDSLSLPSPLRS